MQAQRAHAEIGLALAKAACALVKRLQRLAAPECAVVVEAVDVGAEFSAAEGGDARRRDAAVARGGRV